MKKNHKNLNSNIEKAFHYTDPADYTIQDVFSILKSSVVSHEYLEKASKELRLQSCLLLLNDSLPIQPSLLVRLAGIAKEDHDFKVKDKGHWDVFLKALSKIQDMDDAALLGRLEAMIADREDFSAKLSHLSDETDLPFSAENLSFGTHDLGLSLTEKELINSDVYQKLTDFREILDRFSLLLLNGVSMDEAKAGSGPVTLFSSLLSGNLSSFKKILRDKTESPEQFIGNQPLLFFTLNPILVKNNLNFFIALAKEVSSIPPRIYGESILSMILRFRTKPFSLKKALQICLEKGIVWSFEEWDKQFSSADFEKNQQNLSLLAQCQFQYSAAFDFDSYLTFLKKNILSPDVRRVSLVAEFVSSDIVRRFDEEQRQQFFDGISADRGIPFPAIVFTSMLESGILDKELAEIEPERVAQCLFNVLDRWDNQVELDEDETPVIKHWVGLLKEHNVKHSDYAEILWILRQRKKQTETSRWGRKRVNDIAEVLNVFSKANSRDAFMHFAEKAFPFMNTSDDNDILQKLSLEDFQAVIKNGLVDRLQLKDETLAKFLRYLSLDEFKKLSKGNKEPGDACLNAAASSGKKDILEFLLYDLNIPITGKISRWSWSSADIIVNAALSGQDTILNFIIKRYPGMISERDKDGLLPIHRAARGWSCRDDEEKPSEGKVHNCLAILCGKAEGHDIDPDLLNAPSSEGTPLAIALSNGKPVIAQFLLKCGADVNACPLAEKGAAVLQPNNAEQLERLLDAGADIDVTDQDFNTVFTKFDFDPDSIPLFNKLVKKSKLSTLKQFNIEGRSVLSQLFENIWSFMRKPESRKLLLKTVETLVKKYHFDINARSIDWPGNTPFLEAVRRSDDDISLLRSLIKLGALPDKTSVDGKNAIIVAADDAGIETVKFLVEELKLNINAKDDEGKNCLFYAAGKAEVFAYLIRHGANVHVRDNEGKNLLWHVLDSHEYATFRNLIEEHHLDCAKPSVEDGNIIFQLVDAMNDDLSVSEFSDLLQLCLDNGANINSVRQPYGENKHIVQYILSNLTENEKSLEMLKRILEVPVLKIPKKNSNGDTLLHLVAKNSKASAAEIASFLLEKGLVAVSVDNDDGEWPLHIAARNANIPLCDVLWHENPLGIHQPDNRRGYQPLQWLVDCNADKLDAIVHFVDTYGADPTAEDERQNTILDTYLGESDSTIEGLRYLCEKGARVKHLDKFADKDISFFMEYVSIVFQGDCSKLIREFQLQQDDDAVVEILDQGNIELFRYLTDNGFKIWKHFSDTKWFEQLSISEFTASWLRLFFIEWQWPVSYLTGDSPYLTYFLDHFNSNALPALQLLLDDLHLPANPQDLLEKISGGGRFCRGYNNAVMAYLIKKGAFPELCPAATTLYLHEFENQEIFSDFLDRLADNAENKNFDYKIPDPDDDEKKFSTTLLHQAAENTDNIFALRYLIEKRGLSPDGLRDSRNHTVLEHAAFSGNIKAVHYLLGRMEHIDQDLLNSLLVLALEGDKCYSDNLVKLLVEFYHADPDAKNNFGMEAEALTDNDRLKAYLRRCKKEMAG